jgi:exodeoxyribonuclease VII large subunit
MREGHVYQVSELNRQARSLLEEGIGPVWVRGEISNLSAAPSGHHYFTLKDKEAEISAARFRSQTSLLPSPPLADGMEVLVFGRLTIYEPRGRYQLVVSVIQPAGVGALQLAFERLKAKLAQEGLFAPERKRPLPSFPERMGIVTSPTGAALRDIASILTRRWPSVEALLFPSSVQGETAAEELVAAIRRAEVYSRDVARLDLLIVGRGGGSLEDLAVFNDEGVARAIYASPLPVVSAVGHEIDVTIADLVADLRAPTPSAAAELVVPDQVEVLASLDASLSRLARNLRDALSRRESSLSTSLSSYILRVPKRRVEGLSQELDLRLDALLRQMRAVWREREDRAARQAASLRLVDPTFPLRRGYSMTFRAGSRSPLRRAADLLPGERIETRLFAGQVSSRIEEVIEG